MLKRSYLAVTAAAVGIALLTACSGGGEDAAASNSDRTLRVATIADASSLDPIRGSAGSDHVLLYPIYDTLISFSTDLKPVPGLAESWELTTPTELTLQLREGVKFQDGEPFNAEAVKYNVERIKGEGSNIQSDLASVQEARVDGDHTVTLVLDAPNASLLMVLADRAGMMVSPKAAEAAGGDLSAEPVGAGGWEFTEWRHGESLKVEKFEGYWDQEVDRVAAITFNIIPEPKTRVTSLRGGQQDIALDVAPSDAESVSSASGVSLVQSPRVNIHMAYLNTAVEELSDPNVRRALSIAIDREAVLKSGYFGLGSVADGILPDNYWAEPPASVSYPFDPEAAMKLLADAGQSDLTFDMLVSADAQTTRIGEILKQQWAEVGVTVNLLPREIVQSTQEFFVDKSATALLSQWTGRPDPAMTYSSVFGATGFYNPAGVSPPGLEEALAEQNQSLEIEDRKPGLDKAAEAVFADTPFFPLVFVDSLVGVDEDVQGFELNLLGKAKFLGVSLS